MVGPVFGSMPESAAEALLAEVREGVKDLRKWCLGNGEEGFVTKLALLEQRVGALEKAESRAGEAEWRFWAKIVGVASVAAGAIEGIATLIR